MYQLNLSFASLLFFHLCSSAKGADPAKNDSQRLEPMGPLNSQTTDTLTDNILSRIQHLVDAEVKQGNSPTLSPDRKPTEELNNIAQHGDLLSTTILCPNISKCKTLSLRESRTLKTLAFLAGLKFGKHFLHGAQVGAAGFQNSGSFAASNSLNLFGKVLNTALSVSYGSPLEGDTVADEPAHPGGYMSAVQVHTGVKTPLADPSPLTTAVATSAASVQPSMTTVVPVSTEPQSITTTTTDSPPAFKAIREKSDEDASQGEGAELPSVLDLGPDSALGQPSPLPLKVVDLKQDSGGAVSSHPNPQSIGVRQSQPKTKDQLIYNSRKRFLEEHNERFRKLFGNSAKRNAIPQIGVMLY